MKHKYFLLVVLIGLSQISFTQVTHTILVGSDGFTPKNLEVNQNDQIDFKLNLSTSTGSHTTTSTSVPSGIASWDYNMFCSTCSYTVMASSLGLYKYDDSNSGMSGSFTVSVSTGISENDLVKVKLSQNYPNPFTGSTTFEYNLSSDEGKIIITDLAGKVVKYYNLTNKSGIVEMNEKLNSGLYFYSLWEGNELIETKKMTVK